VLHDGSSVAADPGIVSTSLASPAESHMPNPGLFLSTSPQAPPDTSLAGPPQLRPIPAAADSRARSTRGRSRLCRRVH